MCSSCCTSLITTSDAEVAVEVVLSILAVRESSPCLLCNEARGPPTDVDAGVVVVDVVVLVGGSGGR